jgi:glyoxylase-like metal-dependent hydrolase (beta-lactamase superfamily II)
MSKRMPSTPAIKRFLSSTGVRIYRIPCQVFETLSARVYLLLGAGPPTLVDAGSSLAVSAQQIVAGVDAVHDDFGEAVRPGEVRRIIVSHGHVDHVGGLPELLRAMPAQVAIHPLDRAAVTACREHVVTSTIRLNAFFRRAGVEAGRRGELLAMSPYRWTARENVAVGLTLEDGDELDGLRILHTPGHSPGHVCIGAGDVLLSGDHILSQTLPHLWPESAAAYTGLGHYLDSLAKVDSTPGFTLTLGAHEQPIHDLYGRIKTIRSAHHRRLERMLETLRKAARPLSIDEIARLSYPGVTSFRAVLAITDVGARVEYLHQRGRLSVANLDEIERDETAVYRYCSA